MQSLDLQDVGRKSGIRGVTLPFAIERSTVSIEPSSCKKGMTSRSTDAIVVGFGMDVSILLYFSRGITAVYAWMGSVVWCLMRILRSFFGWVGTTLSSRDIGRYGLSSVPARPLRGSSTFGSRTWNGSRYSTSSALPSCSSTVAIGTKTTDWSYDRSRGRPSVKYTSHIS